MGCGGGADMPVGNFLDGADPHGPHGDVQLPEWGPPMHCRSCGKLSADEDMVYGVCVGCQKPADYCEQCRCYLPGEELTLGLCEECQPTPFEDEDD